MSITITSLNYSLELDKIHSMSITEVNRIPTKTIAGQTAPSTDTDSFTKLPVTVTIAARTTESDKTTLQNLYSDQDVVIETGEDKFTGVLQSIRHVVRPGYLDWISNITMLASLVDSVLQLFRLDISELDGTDILA